MRIVLITLSLAALIFIGSIVLVFSGKNIPTPITQKPEQIDNTAVILETLKSQIKTEQKLDELRARIDQLTGNEVTKPQIQTGTSITPTIPGNGNKDEQITPIPISAKFLSKIMPTIELKRIKNNGIFDLKIFDETTKYSTYEDAKFGMVVVASLVNYDTFLRNFKAIDKSIYTVNETKTFPFPSFYVNPSKSDSTVRIVFAVESETLLVSLPKSKFDTFKKLILSNK